MFLFPVHNYAPQAFFGIKWRSDHAENLCNFSPPAQSKCQCLAKNLLLAAVTLVWTHNPPKNPTCCWTVSQIPKPRVAGVRVCMDTDFGVSIPQPRGVWVNTREGWGGCPGSQHPDPAMARNFMSFLPSILWEGGTAPQKLRSSHHDFFSLIPFFYCTTSVPTDTQLVHHFIMEQLRQNAAARIPFFPPQLYMIL